MLNDKALGNLLEFLTEIREVFGILSNLSHRSGLFLELNNACQ